MEGIKPIQNLENKKNETITLGSLGELEIYSRNSFEYPEAIQNETGIIGYERTIISKEALHKIHEETGGNSGDRLTQEILNKLSDGEFFKLAIHEMGYNAGDSFKGGKNPHKTKEIYAQEFADQKFILQKIFDMNSIEDLGEKDSASFSHPDDTGENTIKFSIFNKENLEVVKEDISPKELDNYFCLLYTSDAADE